MNILFTNLTPAEETFLQQFLSIQVVQIQDRILSVLIVNLNSNIYNN